jgi:hypothetical protein
MKQIWNVLPGVNWKAFIKERFEELLVFGGLASVCYGVSLFSVPSAWIVGGGVLFALGLIHAKG